MTRIYIGIAVLALIVSGVGYLRWDAIRDERKAAELRQAEQTIKDRRKIDEAINDSRSAGDDWLDRLCAFAPDQCSMR